MEPLSLHPGIPSIVIAGSIGAGKTSLINYLLQQISPSVQIAVFTNELGIEPCCIEQVHTVLGGCVCCALQTELIDSICNVITSETPHLIFLELSGLGKLQEIPSMFSYLPDCRLYQRIYVLDMERFPARQIIMGRLLAEQVRSASVLLLNRCQQLSEDSLTASLKTLRDWNPVAPIIPLNSDFSINQPVLSLLDSEPVPDFVPLLISNKESPAASGFYTSRRPVRIQAPYKRRTYITFFPEQ